MGQSKTIDKELLSATKDNGILPADTLPALSADVIGNNRK